MKSIASFFTFALASLLVLAGCTPLSASPTAAPSVSPAPVTSTPGYPLATPYAEQPAAGICASFEGGVVTITLNADMPDPRCAEIRPDQTLRVVNQTLSTLQISLARFSTSLIPGAAYTIDVPFGEYLANGVHQLAVSPCCGAELWLKER